MSTVNYTPDQIHEMYLDCGKNLSEVSRRTGLAYKRCHSLLEKSTGGASAYRHRSDTRYDEDRYKEISDCYQKLGSTRAVARELCCSRDMVRRAIKVFPCTPDPQTPVQVRNRIKNLPLDEIEERYLKGESVTALARHYDVDPERIRKRLRSRGVSMRANGMNYGRGQVKRSAADARICYIVAQACLGRILEKGEVIHHHDEDPTNNHPSNLWYFRGRKDHMTYHGRLRHLQQINPEVQPNKDILARESGGVPLLELNAQIAS